MSVTRTATFLFCSLLLPLIACAQAQPQQRPGPSPVLVTAEMGSSFALTPLTAEQVYPNGLGAPSYDYFFDSAGNIRINLPAGGTWIFDFCNNSNTCFTAYGTFSGITTFDITAIFTTASTGGGGGGGGTVTITGSPTAGELTGFSGLTSITNVNLSGDCTTANSLAITCTKTNGVAFATSATTDATNASNIVSGTLPHAQLPPLVSVDIPNNAASTTGTSANVTGVVATPNGGTGVASPSAFGVAISEGASPFHFIPCNITGQQFQGNNAADPACTSPGVGGRSASVNDTILCDSATALRDRLTTITYTATLTATVPDPTASGCGNNFAFILLDQAGVITVNRTSTATFSIYNGVSILTGQTTFTMAPGQWAAINSLDNTNYIVRLVGNGVIAFSALTDAATITWPLASQPVANADVTFTVHSGARTLNITNPLNGGSYVIWLKQDATGGEGLTLGTGCTWKVISGGGGAITLSATANAIDVLAFTYDGTNCYANLGKNYN